jgi:rhamnogalacturonan endolyase
MPCRYMNINMQVNAKADMHLTITNENGQLLFEKKLGIVPEGNYVTRVNISKAKLLPGNYIVSIRSKNGIQSKMLVKL